MNREERPWGSFAILETDEYFQVKKLVVNPGLRLSLQSHKYRAEHWFIFSGTALVELENTKFEIYMGDSVDIPLGAKHRITFISENPLLFIEVQTGSSFDEDDINRYEDDFGRN